MNPLEEDCFWYKIIILRFHIFQDVNKYTKLPIKKTTQNRPTSIISETFQLPRLYLWFCWLHGNCLSWPGLERRVFPTWCPFWRCAGDTSGEIHDQRIRPTYDQPSKRRSEWFEKGAMVWSEDLYYIYCIYTFGLQKMWLSLRCASYMFAEQLHTQNALWVGQRVEWNNLFGHEWCQGTERPERPGIGSCMRCLRIFLFLGRKFSATSWELVLHPRSLT